MIILFCRLAYALEKKSKISTYRLLLYIIVLYYYSTYTYFHNIQRSDFTLIVVEIYNIIFY